jgi:hypothetical protein
MNYYRITKYNPIYRNHAGWHVRDDWTSISDIGKQYNGVIFTFSDYIRYENAYISAIRLAMRSNTVSRLQLCGIEKGYPKDYIDILEHDTIEYIDKIRNGNFVDYSNIDFCVRMILREMLWVKLIDKDMVVKFGYDYYMYIGSRKPFDKELAIIVDLGLFVDKEVPPLITESF